MSEVMISADKVGFCYRPGAWVLRAASLQVSRGRIIALLGPNGSGKTTLLKLLLGALKPQEGAVYSRGRLGYVPQAANLGFAYSVFDTVVMGRAREVAWFATPSRADRAAACEALEHLGIAHLALRSFNQLSGGERQLVIFARALAANAEILILDEPTAALDLGHQNMVLQLIFHLARARNLTIIFTTHQPQQADAVADDVALMFGVGDLRVGPAGQMLTAGNLQTLFGVRFERASIAGVTPLVPLWSLAAK